MCVVSSYELAARCSPASHGGEPDCSEAVCARQELWTEEVVASSILDSGDEFPRRSKRADYQ